jgi:hypothetical protein
MDIRGEEQYQREKPKRYRTLMMIALINALGPIQARRLLSMEMYKLPEN